MNIEISAALIKLVSKLNDESAELSNTVNPHWVHLAWRYSTNGYMHFVHYAGYPMWEIEEDKVYLETPEDLERIETRLRKMADETINKLACVRWSKPAETSDPPA